TQRLRNCLLDTWEDKGSGLNGILGRDCPSANVDQHKQTTTFQDPSSSLRRFAHTARICKTDVTPPREESAKGHPPFLSLSL
ncbi:unnamed protein product, partial [Heterotrigona itama]